MNRLPREKQIAVVSALVEGCSIRATVRMTGVAKNTIVKLLAELGRACEAYQIEKLANLPCKRLQCDEIWSFVGAKQKNVPADKQGQFGIGDVWTWTAICADTKLVPSWLVADRSATAAHNFLTDLAGRLSNRVQVTSDGLKLYVDAVDAAFGGDVDFAQLVKHYGRERVPRESSLQPRRLHGRREDRPLGHARHEARLHLVRGAPEPHHADEHAPVHPPD